MDRPSSDYSAGKMTFIHVGVHIKAVDDANVTIYVEDPYGLSIEGIVPNTKHLHRDIRRLVNEKANLPIERLRLAFYFDRSLPRPVAIPYPNPPKKK